MSRYRKLDPRFWKDEKVRRFNQIEKLISLYLFTGQSNRIGLFSFSPGEAAEDLGISSQTFAKGFGNVCGTLFLGWDPEARILYLPTWWKYNPPENANNVIGNLKDLDDVPDSPLIDRFITNLEYLPETLHQTFTQTLAKRYPKRSPSQEQEQEQEEEILSGKPDCLASNQGIHPTNGKENVPRRPKSDHGPVISETINCLNQLAGTSYRLTAKATIKHIHARLADGFSLDNFITVLKFKWDDWRDDPKMQKFFRPETLFGSKFEGYLQDAKRNGNGTSPMSEEEEHEWRRRTFYNAK